ncbi:ADP-ribosyltransferase [Mycolicibacterium peregrinum]|uniref:VG15 protein n=1 Tax=Mycolicibacterium peregrinum TaxID=43304 RepID=UPI003AADA7C5
MLQSDPALALKGTATRSVFSGSRDTVITNANREGVRWARHASANACGFCRMLATRGAVYHSQALAKKSHDHCHCLAVPDRDGLYVPAPYVEQWERDYAQARRGGATTPGQIANAMDKVDGGRRAPRAQKSPSAPSAARSGGTGGGPPRRPPTVPPAPGTGGTSGGPDPAWLRRSRTHINGLSGRRRNSVIGYTGPDHERINKWLRRKNAKPDAWVEARVKDLDAVLDANPLPARTVLTRTVDLEAFGITNGEDLVRIVGTQRIERGYMSTTRLPGGGTTKDYKAPVRLTVIAPRGTPAAAVEDISKFPGQGEVLLGRGLGYTIINPTYDGQLGMWRATMLIEPGGGTR